MDRLTRRADFLAAAKASKLAAKASERGFTVQCRDRSDGAPPRLGLTVSRKNGSAVRRNRIKRRLRALTQGAAPDAFRSGCDYVLVARPEAIRLSFSLMAQHLDRALRRLSERG